MMSFIQFLKFFDYSIFEQEKRGVEMGRPRANTVATMIRVNGDLKKQAEAVCEEMGITLSIACSIFSMR